SIESGERERNGEEYSQKGPPREKKRVSPRAVGQHTEVNFESRNPAAVVWRISPWKITETGKQSFVAPRSLCGGSVDKEDGKTQEPPHGHLPRLTEAEDTVP